MEIQAMRATEEWQRAGAYAVRVQGMNRRHHISLKEEFDAYDGAQSRYIVLLDDTYPVATCRFFAVSDQCVLLGRVVVLPEYRGRQLGRRLIREAEQWIQELGFTEIVIDSRLEATGFYQKLGYARTDGAVFKSWQFDCTRMKKNIRRT